MNISINRSFGNAKGFNVTIPKEKTGVLKEADTVNSEPLKPFFYKPKNTNLMAFDEKTMRFYNPSPINEQGFNSNDELYYGTAYEDENWQEMNFMPQWEINIFTGERTTLSEEESKISYEQNKSLIDEMAAQGLADTINVALHGGFHGGAGETLSNIEKRIEDVSVLYAYYKSYMSEKGLDIDILNRAIELSVDTVNQYNSLMKESIAFHIKQGAKNYEELSFDW